MFQALAFATLDGIFAYRTTFSMDEAEIKKHPNIIYSPNIKIAKGFTQFLQRQEPSLQVEYHYNKNFHPYRDKATQVTSLPQNGVPLWRQEF